MKTATENIKTLLEVQACKGTVQMQPLGFHRLRSVGFFLD